MTRAAIAIKYGLFAVIATLVNLAAQRGVLAVRNDEAGFIAAVLCGTAMGLAIKYFLDKYWIFNDRTSGLVAHSRKLTLYTAMGVFTTLIFWGTETTFWLLWGTDLMRELGAVIGLGVGYWAKYNLDKRYVFNTTQRSKDPMRSEN